MVSVNPVKESGNMPESAKKLVKKIKFWHMMETVGLPLVFLIYLIYYLVYSVIGPFLHDVSLYKALCSVAIGGIWLFAAIRNFSIQKALYMRELLMKYLCTDEYLEVNKYVCRKSIYKKKKYNELHLIRAYYLCGQFDEAHALLMEKLSYYSKYTREAQLLYDYYWCEFYSILEDKENFQTCFSCFKERWSQNPVLNRKLRKTAMMLHAQLIYKELMYAGDVYSARTFITGLYKNNKIFSRYEFMNYCYAMGQIEWTLDNLMLAKHWFAQTASFGVNTPVCKEAQRRVEQLDEMQIPYSLQAPADNAVRIREVNTSMYLPHIMLIFMLIFAVIYSLAGL